MISPANFLLLSLVLLLNGCTKVIEPVGTLGPKKLRVYAIKDNDFLSGSRMLVILDKDGNVSAFSGGTVQGAGALSLQAADTAISATAVVVGAKAIQKGLENSQIKVKGIPDTISVVSDNTVTVK